MGNCQAAEAATVVIQHPGNKVERVYWSVSAHQVMESNPGHYVALILTSPTRKTENGMPLKQLKLLRPDDTLHIGQVYRLISFEDVLKEFAAKKCVKLGKVLERGGLGVETRNKEASSSNTDPNPTITNRSPNKGEDEVVNRIGSNVASSSLGYSYRGGGRLYNSQWRPALQSIAEFGA